MSGHEVLRVPTYEIEASAKNEDENQIKRHGHQRGVMQEL
jgi:hypothetical protein